jgi:hypothetical protein
MGAVIETALPDLIVQKIFVFMYGLDIAGSEKRGDNHTKRLLLVTMPMVRT